MGVGLLQSTRIYAYEYSVVHGVTKGSIQHWQITVPLH